ncbi:MAG: ketopantoate reductase family protein [Promethearchaeota archaeon]
MGYKIPRKIKIGFIGAGAIGSLFGGYLAGIKSKEFSIKVVFFCREDHANKINLEGLRINQNGTIHFIHNIKAFKSLTDYKRKDDNLPFDFLFLTTKTYDNEEAIYQYSELVNTSRWFVILQNGIGNEQVIKNQCIKCKLMRIVTSHGALLEKPGYVYHIGIGFTFIGFPFLSRQESNREEIQSDLAQIMTLLNLIGIETSYVENIIAKSWEKAFVNIGINALGALTRLTNGKLVESESLKQIMTEAVREGLKVAELKKINFSRKDIIELTYLVAKKTCNNKNSMLQDVIKQKKTEIDYLNGKIVEYAKELKIKVPINEILTILIKGLEQSYIEDF